MSSPEQIPPPIVPAYKRILGAWRPSGFLIGLSVMLVLLAGGGVSLRQGWIYIPPNWLPWNAPRLDHAPTLFTHLQLNRLSGDNEMCLATLAGASLIRVTPLADRDMDGDCGFFNTVRLDETPVPLNNNVATTCTLGAAFYWWQRRLNGIAREHLKSEISQIRHVGAYACRNVNSETGGNRSQHATANAIDIEAFRTKDGRTISITRNWGKDSAEGRFLIAARNDACKFFNGVLSPDYNAAHATHFHLDMGPYWICR